MCPGEVRFITLSCIQAGIKELQAPGKLSEFPFCTGAMQSDCFAEQWLQNGFIVLISAQGYAPDSSSAWRVAVGSRQKCRWYEKGFCWGLVVCFSVQARRFHTQVSAVRTAARRFGHSSQVQKDLFFKFWLKSSGTNKIVERKWRNPAKMVSKFKACCCRCKLVCSDFFFS